MQPIFRWAGSKRKLIPVLETMLPENLERYIEPFCGSACLFFKVGNLKSGVLSDINPYLINAYEFIKKSPEKLYIESSKISTNKETYLEIRELFNKSSDPFNQAVYFTYLNRNCFNAVYRTNLKGEFNVPMGSRTGRLPSLEVFLEASKKLENVDLLCSDFSEALKSPKEGDFYYLDPPYSTRGKKSIGEYGPGSFCDSDIGRVIQSLDDIDKSGAKFVMSFKDSPNLTDHISDSYNLSRLKVDRHVAGFSKFRGKAREILVHNMNDAEASY